MKHKVGHALRLGLALALLGASLLAPVSACLSPTLPLPPPDRPESITASVDAGFVDIRGRCTPGATVLIENLETGVITGTDDRDEDGDYFIRLEGDGCDRAEVWEVIDNTISSATPFTIVERINGQAQGECTEFGSDAGEGGANGAGGSPR
ncbi:MAG: hypothetical protein AAGA56_18280 [Myxococcota bacterium]